MIPREVLTRQWFHTALTEKEGQALVGHIQGTKKYGLLVPYNDLPEQAKQIVRASYWESRVRAYVAEGLTRSDAQAVVDAEDLKEAQP